MIGATEEGYRDLAAAQMGRCAICGNPPKTNALSWDHDHRTGKPRGLLCFRCNRLLLGSERLGGLSLMRKAVSYLEKWSSVRSED